MTAARRSTSRAFTLIELIVVIVILAILSGIAIPKYIDYTAKAKESATKGVLGGVRSAIANFYANGAVGGSAAFPTLTNMTTVGVVMQEDVQHNPYLTNTGATTMAAATWAATPPVAGTSDWNYDAASGRFWANSDTGTIHENLW